MARFGKTAFTGHAPSGHVRSYHNTARWLACKKTVNPYEKMKKTCLQMLPKSADYASANDNDPLRFYYWRVLGKLYRRRVELCLELLPGGERVLEVGFGSGVSFLNLSGLYREIYGLDLEA